jgi:hypothetical protein
VFPVFGRVVSQPERTPLTGRIGGRRLFATRLTSGVVKLPLYSASETAPKVAAAFVVESSF